MLLVIIKSTAKWKKIPCIPRIFYKNKYVTGFKEKSEIFNCFFADQCSLIPNRSVSLPELTLLTENTLTSCDFSKTDIPKIINNQDSNNALGHNIFSIRMLKLCGESICRPLNIIFKTCIRTGKFPLEWKKANVVPIYKKDYKQIIKNYRSVSLLTICGKIFEHLLYDVMFDLFSESNSSEELNLETYVLKLVMKF